MPTKKKAARKKRGLSVAARAASQKQGFAGTIVRGSKAQGFTSGTPNVATVKPPQYSTTASSAAVSMSTSELLARQRKRQQQQQQPHSQPQQRFSVGNIAFIPGAAAAGSKGADALSEATSNVTPVTATNTTKRPGALVQDLGNAMIVGAAPKISTEEENGGGARRKRGKKKVRKRRTPKVPDFMSPEKGVLILGTLRPADGQEDRFRSFDQSPASDIPTEYIPPQHTIASRRLSSAGTSPSGGRAKPSGSHRGRKHAGHSNESSVASQNSSGSGGFGSTSSTGRLPGADFTDHPRRRIVRRKCRSASGRREPPEMHMLTSPRVSHREDPSVPGCPPASELVLSWQPLGSPVRRMKRAMRFVQQNTCVTQRVTVDIGSAARLVIPCFEGITTISDLIETVRHRFPKYGITGLQQPLTAAATRQHPGSYMSRSRRAAWNSVEERTRGGKVGEMNGAGVHGNYRDGEAYAMELDPGDFVSVAVGSDSALVAVGTNIPEDVSETVPSPSSPAARADDASDVKRDENEIMNANTRGDEASSDVKISIDGAVSSSPSTTTNMLTSSSSSSSFTRNVTYTAGAVPSPMKHTGHVPKTPARKGAPNTSWVKFQPEERDEKEKGEMDIHDANMIHASGETGTTGRVEALRLISNPSSLSATGSPQLVLTSAREEPDRIPETEAAATTCSPPGFNYRHRLSENVSVSVAGVSGVDTSDDAKGFASAGSADSETTLEPQSMANVVRNRLMHRIKALAEKGAISPSQRGYLNNLISVPSTKVIIPSPPDATLGSDLPPRSLAESNTGGRTRHHPHRTLTPTNQDASQLLGVPAPPAAGDSM